MPYFVLVTENDMQTHTHSIFSGHKAMIACQKKSNCVLMSSFTGKCKGGFSTLVQGTKQQLIVSCRIITTK